MISNQIGSPVKCKVLFHGQPVSVEIYVFGRNGEDSPETWVLRYKGRWISPLEMRVRGWVIQPSVAFKIFYRDVDLGSIILAPNPFLKLIPKEPDGFGKYIPVPLVYQRDE